MCPAQVGQRKASTSSPCRRHFDIQHIGQFVGRRVRALLAASSELCGTLKHWSCSQKAVGRSSAEAELYARNRSVADALGIQSFAADFGIKWRVPLRTNASAAFGMARRRGAGKL